MKLVVDAVGVRPGSAAIVLGNTLRGWSIAFPDDSITVLTDGRPQFSMPPATRVLELVPADPSPAARLWAQSVGVRRACRAERADALLSAVTASSFLGARCPAGAIVYDVRHELRPDQFSRRRRIARKVLYGWSFHRADALFCISERTRNDLIRPRPRLAEKALTTLLGADHAAGWTPGRDPAGKPYVLAFGHSANKNVAKVVQSWAIVAAARPDLVLKILGVERAARPGVDELVGRLGLQSRVDVLPWLDDEQFQQTFAGAAAILFPSDFEGFGMPALEAMLLGLPVVVSSDPALLEVSGGHASVAANDDPATLAVALIEALTSDQAKLDAAAQHARGFVWTRTATQMRTRLAALA